MSRSAHLLDPDLRAGATAVPRQELSTASLAGVRAAAEKYFLELDRPDDPAVVIEDVVARAADHEVAVRLYRPARAAGPVAALLDVHGGGFVLGSIELNDSQNRRVVREMGCLVAAVRYRLAPETAFPGPVEDCYAALAWLGRNATELGVDPARLVIMGGSAGGGLAAGTALLARDRAEITLAGQILLWPMLDDRTCVSSSRNPFVGEFGWSTAENQLGWRAFLGMEPGASDVSPYAAPARASTLEGLPRTFLATTTLDLFLEENLDYATRLMRAGVATDLRVYPGAYHGFMRAAPDAGVSRTVQRDVDAALRHMLGKAKTPDPAASHEPGE